MRYFPVLSFLLFLSAGSVAAGEPEERERLRQESARLFAAGKYEELEKLAGQYLVSKEKTGSGTWKLVWFHKGIMEMRFDRDDDRSWDQALAKIEDWRRKYPDSGTPVVAYGGTLIERASLYRGGQYLSQVSRQDLEAFVSYMSAAAEYMAQHYEAGSKDPYWYVRFAWILRNISGDNTQFLSIIDEGIERYPDFDELYFVTAGFLNPKWHGSAEAVSAFAERTRNATYESRGNELYARIFWAAGNASDGSYLSFHPSADWSMMVTSMDEIIAKYPAQWNINYFGMLTCFKRDWENAGRYLDMIEEPIIADVWSGIEMNYQKCRLNAGLGPSPNIPLP